MEESCHSLRHQTFFPREDQRFQVRLSRCRSRCCRDGRAMAGDVGGTAGVLPTEEAGGVDGIHDLGRGCVDDGDIQPCRQTGGEICTVYSVTVRQTMTDV